MRRFHQFILFLPILFFSFSLMSAGAQETKPAKGSKPSQEEKAAQEAKENEAKIASMAAKAAKENGISQEEMQNLIELKQGAPRVFIDFQRGDMDFIRDEIPFVNYVRDRKEADVHVMVTTQQNGAGGNKYTIDFIGLGEYADVKNSLTYDSNKTNTQEEVRIGYTNIIKLGLTPYAARTPICELISSTRRASLPPICPSAQTAICLTSLSGSATIRLRVGTASSRRRAPQARAAS